MSDVRNDAGEATPHADLIKQIMNSRVPKNEREWAAAREIERLRGLLWEADPYLVYADNKLQQRVREALGDKT